MKKILTILFSAALLLATLVPITANAEGSSTQTWVKGSEVYNEEYQSYMGGLNFTFADPELASIYDGAELLGYYVDGNKLDGTESSVQGQVGYVHVSLFYPYLNELSSGEHTLKVDVKNSDGATKEFSEVFKVDENSSQETGYNAISGSNSVYEKGSDDKLVFTFKNEEDDTNTYENFVGIKIDSQDVDPTNYTAEEGSVVITLNKDYVNTLPAGEHTLTAIFDDGEADAKFTINNPSPTQDTTPANNTQTNNTSTNNARTNNTPASSDYKAPTTGVDRVSFNPIFTILGASIIVALLSKKK